MYKLRPKLVVKRYYKRYEGRGSAGSHHLGVCIEDEYLSINP